MDDVRLRSIVKDSFTEEFGEDMVKDVRVTKYPETYGVVVLVKRKEADRMFTLSHKLMDQFESQGLPVSIYAQEVR